MMAKYISILIFYLTISISAFAQLTKVGGTIVDENGEPLELVTVRIENSSIGTISNLKGRYSLKFQSRDSVVIIYSMLGYNTRKRTLKNPKGNISLNITLPALDYEIGEVVVSENKRQTGTLQQINAKAGILQADASGGNIETILSTLPGVTSNNELSTQYNVRGGSYDENLVYVNGTEIYRPLLIRAGQQEGLSFINPDMVSKIEFSTGGFEARYGDKISSVLDVTYKRPQELEASAMVSLLGASAYVGFGNSKWSWTNGVRFKSNRYLLGTLDTKGEYDPRFIDYQTYLTWNINKCWEVGVIGNISQNRYLFKPEDRNTRFGTLEEMREFRVFFSGQEKDLFNTYFGAGSLTYKMNEYSNISFQLAAFRTNEEETYDITGQYWLKDTDQSSSTTDSDEIIGVGSYMEHARNYLNATVQSYTLSGISSKSNHTLKWGVNYRRELINDRISEWEMRDSAGYSLSNTSLGPELIYSLKSRNQISSHRLSIYLQDNFRIQSAAGLFVFTAGLRGSHWSWNKEFLFSPRASIALIPKFNEQFTFRIASGIYYQAPFYKEMRELITDGNYWSVELNKQIKSPRSIQYIIGADYSFKALDRPFKVSAEFYYKALDNIIPYTIDNVRISYYGRNMGKGYATGVDMKLFGEFVPGADSWISLSWIKTEEKIENRWIPRPTDQRYNLSLYFTDYFPGNQKWKLNLRGVLAGGLPFGPSRVYPEAREFRTPSYKRVDIGMSRLLLNNTDKHLTRFGRNIKSIWLGLDLFNLLNINNVNSYYWVTDVNNNQFAIPNYLTSRQINLRLLIDF